jgi:hypothetical protein
MLRLTIGARYGSNHYVSRFGMNVSLPLANVLRNTTSHFSNGSTSALPLCEFCSLHDIRLSNLFYFSAVLILPMGLYQIISHSMTLNLNEDESAKQFFQAKAITFGIFLGTILVFFGPIFLWKWLVSNPS